MKGTSIMNAVKERIGVRWTISADLPRVLEIEDACFGWDAWTEEELRAVLSDRCVIGMVAEQGEQVIGHMVYLLRKGSIRLLDFAIDPAFQRSGVGESMMAKLTCKLSARNRTRLNAVVPEGNLPFLAFLRSFGFRAEKVLRGHFDDGSDGYLMRLRWTEQRE